MSAEPLAVECSNLRRTYTSRKLLSRGAATVAVALDGLDLTIPKATVFGLLGPNGAGKTTTVRILATLLAPTAGTARVLGKDVMDDAAEVRRSIGLILGGDRGLYTRISARENLLYHAALNRMDRSAARRRADELLDRVGLTERANEPVERYSRGMKQRVHIARGLMTDPQVLFMDEPTIGLDPEGAQQIRDLIPELADGERTILLTTHYMLEADQLCDTLAIVDRGRVAAQGTPTAIKQQFSQVRVVEVVIRTPSAELRERVGALPGVHRVDVSAEELFQKLTVQIGADENLETPIREAIGTDNIESLIMRGPTLEEAYLSILH